REARWLVGRAIGVMGLSKRVPGRLAPILDLVELQAEVPIFQMVGKAELGLDDIAPFGVDPQRAARWAGAVDGEVETDGLAAEMLRLAGIFGAKAAIVAKDTWSLGRPDHRQLIGEVGARTGFLQENVEVRKVEIVEQ